MLHQICYNIKFKTLEYLHLHDNLFQFIQFYMVQLNNAEKKIIVGVIFTLLFNCKLLLIRVT